MYERTQKKICTKETHFARCFYRYFTPTHVVLQSIRAAPPPDGTRKTGVGSGPQPSRVSAQLDASTPSLNMFALVSSAVTARVCAPVQSKRNVSVRCVPRRGLASVATEPR